MSKVKSGLCGVIECRGHLYFPCLSSPVRKSFSLLLKLMYTHILKLPMCITVTDTLLCRVHQRFHSEQGFLGIIG